MKICHDIVGIWTRDPLPGNFATTKEINTTNSSLEICYYSQRTLEEKATEQEIEQALNYFENLFHIPRCEFNVVSNVDAARLFGPVQSVHSNNEIIDYATRNFNRRFRKYWLAFM